MKQYYALIDTNVKPLTAPVTTYWCGDSTKASFLTRLRGFVLPLGTRKPRNVSRETIYQF